MNIELGPMDVEKLRERAERTKVINPPLIDDREGDYFDRHAVIYEEPDDDPTPFVYEIVGRLAYCLLGIVATTVLALLFVSCGPVVPSEPKSLNPCAELCELSELCKCNQVCRTVDRATECHVWVRR